MNYSKIPNRCFKKNNPSVVHDGFFKSSWHKVDNNPITHSQITVFKTSEKFEIHSYVFHHFSWAGQQEFSCGSVSCQSKQDLLDLVRGLVLWHHTEKPSPCCLQLIDCLTKDRMKGKEQLWPCNKRSLLPGPAEAYYEKMIDVWKKTLKHEML